MIGKDMNSFEKIRWKRLARVIAYSLVVLLGVICILELGKYIGKKPYYVPEAEVNVEYGIPLQVELEELIPKENIRIGFHHPVYIEKEKLYMYLTNYKECEVAISAFLYDEDRNMYASSGMIKPDQFLPYLLLNQELLYEKEYYINIAFYNINDMTSEGSIWIKLGKLRNGD